MTGELAIHAANGDELAAAHRNVYDIWSQGRPLDEHVQFRLTSPKHRLATWYVGTLAGEVVVSLGAYPLRFHLRGQIVPGFAIGSVYTVTDFRRRGYAEQLLDWVEREERGRGAAIAILYSDIAPDYYARLGYAPCPSFEGWCDVQSAPPAAALDYRLVEISAADHTPELIDLYTGYHGKLPLAIARDREYWQALLARFVEDRFFFLADRAGNRAGYVRLNCSWGVWQIRDYALAEQSDEAAEGFYTAVFTLARASGAARLGGWLPDLPAARRQFRLSARPREITMIKSLAGHEWDDLLIAATSRFCEVDHV